MNEETHTTIFPHFATPVSYHWVSTSVAAKKMGRSERLMRYWCIRGRWASLNVPTYKDASGRWWIHISEED